MPKEKKNTLHLNLFVFIFMAGIFLCSAPPVHAEPNAYYYLQVGSFQSTTKALHFAQELRLLDENAITRGEDVPALGYWYRVYLGPFSSFQEGSQKQLELRKKGFYAELSFIRKTTSLIQSNVTEEPEATMKSPPVFSEKKMSETIPSEPPAISVSESKEETAPVLLTKSPSAESTAPEKKIRKGHGKNVGKHQMAVSLKHTYLETHTEVTIRTFVTSNGVTTTTQNIPVENIDRNGHPTSMNFNTARLRFGITDYFELFADIGMEFSTRKPVWGAGLRWNIYATETFYIAVLEEFLMGSMEEDYTGPGDSKWKKYADWKEFTAKVELGVIKSKFSAYIGGLYFKYFEDTKRRLLENLPAPLTRYQYEDELEEEYNYGIYGGVEYYFTPAISLNVEGQAINQNRISAKIEYHF